MINRRSFIASTAVSLVLPTWASAGATLQYTPGMVDRHLANGETVFVDFHTNWCSTCAAQERIISALRADNPAYDKAVTFIKVDWDVYSKDKLSRRLNIPRRSTLVVLKGDQELGRIVAGTARKDIQALMDRALQAATA